MTDTDTSRFVATALGLMTENQQAWDPYVGYYSVESLDFLSPAGADLLLRTLLEQCVVEIYIIDAQEFECRLTPHEPNDLKVKSITATGAPTYREALLDAAYRLLKTDWRPLQGDSICE
jgi:hypothetical protein